MKRIARIILWNVYAWPITIILLVAFAMSWHESPVRIMLVFLLFMPALIVLHLNVWDKEVGTPTSRKAYAFTFLTCILFFFIVLPLFRSKPLNHEIFLGLLILLPLFIAVFSYAFRNWEGIKNQPSLGRKSKIIIIMSDVLLIILIIISLIYLVFVFHFKNMYSRNNEPYLYIVPVERKIVDIENQTQDNVKINYANFEMKLPCKKIEKRFDSAKYKVTGITIDKSKPKGIIINPSTFILPKDEYEKGTAFETYSKILYMTPDKLNFFTDYKIYHYCPVNSRTDLVGYITVL
jgi:hypothetical protein